MKGLRLLKRLIQKVDAFRTTELLRYKSEPQYNSFFGGILTIFIFFVVIVVFYNRLIQCLEKDNISLSKSTFVTSDPKLIEISTYPKGNFMLGMNILDLDLNHPSTRYFDLKIFNHFRTYNQTSKFWIDEFFEFKFEPCTSQHWQGFPDALKELNINGLSQIVCMPMGVTFSLEGKQLSSNRKNLIIQISPCTNESDPSRPCASNEQIATFLKVQETVVANLFFINPSINAQNKKYLSYFLDDRYYTYFTRDKSSQGIIYVQDYEIQTDQSIHFIEDTHTEAGGMIIEPLTTKDYVMAMKYNSYCQFMFQRSALSKKFKRTFQTIDDIVSFLGGLLGMAYSGLFIVKLYNNFGYEMSMGSKLFKPQKTSNNTKNSFKKYNFLIFLKQNLYTFLRKFKVSPKWQTIIEYKQCKKEMRKQLDVVQLFKRMVFLESAVQILLSDHQVKGLHLREKMSLNQVKKRRKDHRMKTMFRKKQKAKKQKSSLKKFKQKSYLKEGSIIQKVATENVKPKKTVHFRLNQISQTEESMEEKEKPQEVQEEEEISEQEDTYFWEQSSDQTSENSDGQNMTQATQKVIKCEEKKVQKVQSVQKIQKDESQLKVSQTSLMSLTRKRVKQIAFKPFDNKIANDPGPEEEKQSSDSDSESKSSEPSLKEPKQVQEPKQKKSTKEFKPPLKLKLANDEINFSMKKNRFFKKKETLILRRVSKIRRNKYHKELNEIEQQLPLSHYIKKMNKSLEKQIKENVQNENNQNLENKNNQIQEEKKGRTIEEQDLGNNF